MASALEGGVHLGGGGGGRGGADAEDGVDDGRLVVCGRGGSGRGGSGGGGSSRGGSGGGGSGESGGAPTTAGTGRDPFATNAARSCFPAAKPWSRPSPRLKEHGPALAASKRREIEEEKRKESPRRLVRGGARSLVRVLGAWLEDVYVYVCFASMFF